MLRYHLGTGNDFHLGFKPVLSYGKPHTHAFTLSTQATEQNDRRVKRSKIKTKGVKKIEF